MAQRKLPFVLLILSCATAACLAEDEPSDLDLPAAVAGDDDCTEVSSSCALNALQLKGRKVLSAAELDEASNDVPLDFGCTNCMQKNAIGGVDDGGAINGIWHYAQNCWTPCGGVSGPCPSFCGPGNLCCRYMSPDPACSGVSFFPVLHMHTCVAGVVPPDTPTGMPPPTSLSHVYSPTNAALAQPSDSEVLTFYMYRVMGDATYPAENVNAANLAGVMWYLHNEVVPFSPRKFGITRIVRLKVSTRAPKPLKDLGMNFGVRYAFDSGKCTGPWDCQASFDKYGYFVGCNYVGDFPTAKWKKDNHYKEAIWYSLPGPCSDRAFSMHDTSCVVQNPGGACSGSPTGTGDCTFTYENAGEIRVDELVGITDYQGFLRMGGKEWIRTMDRGWLTSFWDGMHDEAACQHRLDIALRLFKAKYGGEDLPSPPCDFNYDKFYG